MPGTWFEILEVARVLSSQKTGFTALDLKEAAKIKEMNEASAWLSKFAKWGYVVKVGKEPGNSRKPFNVYSLTDYGKTVSPKTSHKERLEALISAVEAYSLTRGKAAEAKGWKTLEDQTLMLREGLKKEAEARARGQS